MNARTLTATLLSAVALVAGCSTGHPSEANFNLVDVRYARKMATHHEQAVQLADLVPGHSGNQELIELAREVRAAELPKIERMNGWLREWNAADGHRENRAPGKLSSDELAALEHTQGEQFDRMWLQKMLEHHRGGMKMAQNELDSGAHAGARKTADALIRTQRPQALKMTRMLG